MSGDKNTNNLPSRTMTTLGLLPLVALSTALSAPVAAQEANLQLDEILVQGKGKGGDAREDYKVDESSSVKFTAPLLDTPKTVNIITQKQMEDRGLSSVADVFRSTPGVTIGAGEGGTPMGDRPFIRGFEASTDVAIDGIRSLGRTSYEAFNLESIEILKGPGSAYSGRGSTGGSVNMVSKGARFGENFHDLTGMIGTDSQYRGTYDGNVSTDELAGRLNLMWQNAHVPGRDVVFQNRWGAAGSIAAKLGDLTTLTLRAYHYEGNELPDYGVPMANAAYVSLTGDTSRGDGTKANPFLPAPVSRSNYYNPANRDYRNINTTTASATLEHEFNERFRVETSLHYLNTRQEYITSRVQGVDNGGVLEVTRGMLGRDQNNTTLAHVTNFSGEFDTGFVEHSFAFGYELSREELYSGSISGLSVDNTDFWNPNPWLPVTGTVTHGARSLGNRTTTASAYVMDTMKFSDQWLLNAGLRFDDYKVETASLSNHSQMLNYQVGLTYKPAPNGAIYIAHGTSANPSGQTQGLGGGSSEHPLSNGTKDLDPEITYSYELGTKWDLFDERLSVTAALFYTDKINRRVTDADGNTSLEGNVTAKGVELGLSGRINDRWEIAAGYTYTDAVLVDLGYTGGPANPVPNANNGNRPINIAPHSFGLWTAYDVTDKWKIGGGVNFVDARFVNDGNTAKVPSYWRMDLMTSYAFNQKTSVQLNVNNVFDAVTYDSSHAGLFALVGPGRNAQIRFKTSF